MLSLHPSTRQIAVISDVTQTGQLMQEQLNAAVPDYSERVRFTPLVGLPATELETALQRLPQDSLVLLLSYLRDRDGVSYPLSLAPKIVRAHSEIPVYTLWDDYITDGVLGGFVLSSRHQGIAAVRLVDELLQHGSIRDYTGPIIGQINYRFNYQEMKRLGLSRYQFPADSEIINEPQTFYYRYRYGVWGVVLIFGWLVATVMVLTRNNFRRQQAEHALKEKKEFTEELLDAIAVPLFYRDTKGVYLGSNKAGVDFFGFAEDQHDLIGKTNDELFPKNLAEKAKQSDEELIRNGGVQCYENTVINSLGQPRNVIYHKALFHDGCGAVAGVVGTMLDITDLKKAQQLASRFGRILDSSLEEIYLIDGTRLTLLRTTLGARKKLGYRQGQLLQLKITDILADQNLETFKQLVHPLNTGEKKTLVFIGKHRCRDATTYPVEIHMQQTELEGERVYVLMAHDISERLKLEQLKNEMLSMVSHEMRTPLTAMLGFTEFIIENDPEPAMRRECLSTVYDETLKLKELIDNLLNLQQFRAKKLSPKIDDVIVYPLLRDATHLFSHASERHQITLECPEDLPALRGDRDQLLQVLKNLLSNAIKYSPAGGMITLAARDHDATIQISVTDQGMGIAEADQPLIFDHFYRVDNSDCRRIGGTGLGLALVKEIILAHHGQAWLESCPDHGTTFYIALPKSSS